MLALVEVSGVVFSLDGIVYVDGASRGCGNKAFVVYHEANVNGEVEEAEGSGWDVVGHGVAGL